VTARYSATVAFRESTALASTDVFAEYCVALDSYVTGNRGAPVLGELSRRLAIEVRRRGWAPERVFHALRMNNCVVSRTDTNPAIGTARDQRYTLAIRMFLVAYFGL
jgi:hypothetical protein